MRFPRWLLISLWTATMLGALAATGWWWTTWPERTAREYLVLCQEGKWDEIDQVFGDETWTGIQVDDEQRDHVRSILLMAERIRPAGRPSILDIAMGRRRFVVYFKNDLMPHPIVVQRGRIQ